MDLNPPFGSWVFGFGSTNSGVVVATKSASLLTSFKISDILWAELDRGQNTKVIELFFIFLTP